MLSGRLRSASKAVNLIPILKSSLVVVDCWLASLLDQANVVELMGKSKGLLFFFFCIQFSVSSYFASSPFFSLSDTSWKEKNWSSIWRRSRGRKARLLVLLLKQFISHAESGLFVTCFGAFVFCLDGPKFVLTNATLKILLGMSSCFKLDCFDYIVIHK